MGRARADEGEDVRSGEDAVALFLGDLGEEAMFGPEFDGLGDVRVAVLDEGGEDGLATELRADEEMGIGQEATDSAEFRDGMVGLREEHGELPSDREIGWRSRWNGGVVSLLLSLDVGALGVGKGSGAH